MTTLMTLWWLWWLMTLMMTTLMTPWWLSDDSLMTPWRLPDDFLKTFFIIRCWVARNFTVWRMHTRTLIIVSHALAHHTSIFDDCTHTFYCYIWYLIWKLKGLCKCQFILLRKKNHSSTFHKFYVLICKLYCTDIWSQTDMHCKYIHFFYIGNVMKCS